MKKFVLLALLYAGANNCSAQSLTINNTTTCGISFSVKGSDIGTCNSAYSSTGTATLAAGNSVTYTNTTSLSWATPPPVNIDWSGIIILDDGQMKYADVYAACTSLPQTATYTSPCNGAAVNVTWTDNGSGSATVDIRQ